MKRFLSASLTFLLLQSSFCLVFAPISSIAQTAAASAPPNQMPTAPLAFGLQDGTPVKLRINRTMSSADAKTGETVDFEVLEEVKIGENIIIPRGGVALGTVTLGKPRGRMGKGGKLDINIDSVRLTSGEKVALRAVKESKGGGRGGAMTGAIVATSILFFPAAPFFLFMKGKDITVPKGTEITAYINGDVPLDPQRFTAMQTGQSTAPAAAGQNVTALVAETTSISVKSTPDGAEIMVDGKFAGSTPSTLQLKAGEHTIVVKKPGFVLWERPLSVVSGSSVTIDAALEKIP